MTKRKSHSYVRLTASRNGQTINLDFPTNALNALLETRTELRNQGYEIEQFPATKLFTDVQDALHTAELFTR